jgi:hypothetical protein
MPAKVGRTKPIQKLIDKGRDSKCPFEAERVLDRALAMSHARRDFAGMVEILELLADARGARRKLALASRAAIRIVDDAVTDTMDIEKGRYLVQPPLVGADARRLRLLALARETPVMVICREPTAQTGEIPVVAIGPQGSIRTKVAAHDKTNKPSAAWFRSALQSLGEESVLRLNPKHAADRRLDVVLDLIDTLPEDNSLHQTAIELCRQADAADC